MAVSIVKQHIKESGARSDTSTFFSFFARGLSFTHKIQSPGLEFLVGQRLCCSSTMEVGEEGSITQLWPSREHAAQGWTAHPVPGPSCRTGPPGHCPRSPGPSVELGPSTWAQGKAPQSASRWPPRVPRREGKNKTSKPQKARGFLEGPTKMIHRDLRHDFFSPYSPLFFISTNMYLTDLKKTPVFETF